MKKYYLWSLVILVIGTALAIFGVQNGSIKTINQEGNLLYFSRQSQIIIGDQKIALVSGHSLPRTKSHSYQLTQPFQKVKVAHQQLNISDYDSHGAMGSPD